MSKPTLYGVSASRAIRSLWAAEEVGLDYQHIATDFRGGTGAPAYLAINPNGRIPALVDGDLTLFESMAINLYLAERYGKGLLPTDLASRARCQQWSVWAISEIEPLQMQIVVQRFFVPEERRDPAVIETASQNLQRPLKVLDGQLADHEYLLGDTFTIADLNVAAVMALLKMVKFDYSSYSHVQQWADTCYARPSWAAAQARD